MPVLDEGQRARLLATFAQACCCSAPCPATPPNLASTPFIQAVEVGASRLRLQRAVLRRPEIPQLVLRVGWPAGRLAGHRRRRAAAPCRRILLG